MKLKKIASLALAGIMAVSMLAGCSNEGNTPDNNEEDNQVVARVYLRSRLICAKWRK